MKANLWYHYNTRCQCWQNIVYNIFEWMLSFNRYGIVHSNIEGIYEFSTLKISTFIMEWTLGSYSEVYLTGISSIQHTKTAHECYECYSGTPNYVFNLSNGKHKARFTRAKMSSNIWCEHNGQLFTWGQSSNAT